MSNLVFIIVSTLVVGLLLFLVRVVLKRLLGFFNRPLAWFGMLLATLILAVVLYFTLVPLEATNLNLTEFATSPAEVQSEALDALWAELTGTVWAGLIVDSVFILSYTVLLVLTWTWISQEARKLKGHGLIKIIDGFMIVVSFTAGAVDLLENTALAFLLLGRDSAFIRLIAKETAQLKLLLPLLPNFTSPAAALWLLVTRKARRRTMEKTTAVKNLQKLKASNPSRFVLGPIIGGMTSSSSGTQVKLWAKSLNEGRLYAWIGKQPDLTDVSEPVGIAALKKENGYAAAIPIAGLPPNSFWYYGLTLSAEPPGKSGRKFPSFTIYPEPDKAVPFNFYFGSCYRPEFPLPADNEVRIFQSIQAGMDNDALRFGLMMGDQIYADSVGHNGMDRIPETAAEYRRVYAHSWTQPDLRSLMMNLPVYMTLDDHEVDDDWRWVDLKRKIARNPLWVRLSRWFKRVTPRNISLERLSAALHVFYEHQLLHAPDLIHYPTSTPGTIPSLIPPEGKDDPGGACYSFSYGAASFFVLDVRTRRVWRLFGEKSIMDEPQWQALETWLREDPSQVKFIVSSSGILMRYWYDLIYDRWGAYVKDRERIINMIAENNVEHCYILSGDVHTANAVTAELDGENGSTIILKEFCASPFQQESGGLKKFGFDTRPFGKVKKITFEHEAVLQPNYGVVRVNFTDDEPDVKFEIRDAEGLVIRPK